jgi:hypothetical protein
VRNELSGCAEKSQNITDICKNINGISTNINGICKNLNDILTFFCAPAEYIPQCDGVWSAPKLIAERTLLIFIY